MSMTSQDMTSFGSKARRFTRRLSYGISKVLKDWNNDPNNPNSKSLALELDERNARVFNIDELVAETKFTRAEIQFIYRDFKLKCPDGILTEKNLNEIYSQIFSCGDTSILAKHLFSAMIHQNSRMSNVFFIAPLGSMVTELNFRDFLVTLSSIMRGTIDDKIKWLFNFYDINRDGRITPDEVSSLVRSMYDLMGPNVNPPVDEAAINRHVEFSIQKLGLHQKHDQTLTYVEFHKLFSNNQELIEIMMKVF